MILSGIVFDSTTRMPEPYVNVVLKHVQDSSFITGVITNEEGIFELPEITPGEYLLSISMVGYNTLISHVSVGTLSHYLDLGKFYISESRTELSEIVIAAKQDEINGKMDKKTFDVEEMISQGGGSILDILKTLPGVTVSAEGKVQMRGSENVVILVDGRQTALTGFGNQTALDNIPASAIDRIEIINNPSSKYDANGNGGIINIVLKKESTGGLHGKAGFAAGAGALWIKHENLPSIRPQYRFTPKINPSFAMNYRKNKLDFFAQADYLYTHTLNKNEFVGRTYDNGDTVIQQTKRNRNTGFLTLMAGFDYNFDERNVLSISNLFSSEKIIDNGDEPFYNGSLSERLRLWQFLEDELKTTVTSSVVFFHKYKQPGRTLRLGFNYTFHRENEKYFFDNYLPTYTGHDAFKLLSDENVADLNVDYVRPLKYGRFETGLKVRGRFIPTNMQFFPGYNSPIDTNAGGWANYNELIPALYGNYVYENKWLEVETGLRVEYVDLKYRVNPAHNTYHSDGYNYFQPFPNARLTFKLNSRNRISLFCNRRVDRPNEVDIRIFPKYDDAEIIKVGNPALKPQFTTSFEAGYKNSRQNGYLYAAVYFKTVDGTITRISSIAPGSNVIYNVFQNAGKSYTTGGSNFFIQCRKMGDF